MTRLEEQAREALREIREPEICFPWDRIASEDREEILRQAEAYASSPYPMRRATDFLAFVRSGSRKADEDPYFFRRRKLCYAALALALGEDYLDDVLDGIWCICEESSWVISAHNVNQIQGAPAAEDYPLPDPDRPYVDLFSAQTGMILTLVGRMAEKQLNAVSPEVVRRIGREIRKRILDPFMGTDDFWWMGFRRKDLCNWTPWIVSNVMLCGLSEPLAAEERREMMIRACGMLDRWMDTVPEDGGCDEGAGYWNMAGGALLDCLEMLEKISGGRMACWQAEKIRNILSFPEKAEIGNGYFLNFADCDARPMLSGERIQTAGEKLGDPALEALGSSLRGKISAELADVPHLTRLLRALFHPRKAGEALSGPEGASPADVWLPDLQVRTVRRGRWILAAKGGHNGENHNHNDVGSFMLYLDRMPEIVDAGNMTYTAKTFSGERYELWNTRSAFHNLPLIGGQEQRAGAEHRAREVSCLPDGLELDLAEAYGPEAGAERCVRRLELSEGGLRITDEIDLRETAEVTWVFLLRNEPRVTPRAGEGSLLTAGGIRLEIPEGWKTETEEIPVTDPRMAANWPGSLWRIRISGGEKQTHRAVWEIGTGDE